MPEVSCKACQKETFLCNQTVSVLTCPCSTCSVPPQNRSCSAPGLHGRMLVKLSSWLGRPPQSRSDPCWLVHALMLELLVEHFGSTEGIEISLNCPPAYRGMTKKNPKPKKHSAYGKWLPENSLETWERRLMQTVNDAPILLQTRRCQTWTGRKNSCCRIMGGMKRLSVAELSGIA